MICVYKKQIGFSLVELIIVCLLIAILLSIGIPAYMNSKHKADKQKGVFNLYAIYQAQKAYYFDQEPPQYASNFDQLSPAYAELNCDNDGTWMYALSGGGGGTYSITARHVLSSGALDGYSISMDQTGTIDDRNWPY